MPMQDPALTLRSPRSARSGAAPALAPAPERHVASAVRVNPLHWLSSLTGWVGCRPGIVALAAIMNLLHWLSSRTRSGIHGLRVGPAMTVTALAWATKVVGATPSVSGATELVSGATELVLGATLSVSGATLSVSGATELVSGATLPVSGATELVLGAALLVLRAALVVLRVMVTGLGPVMLEPVGPTP